MIRPINYFDERVAALSGLHGAGNYFVINSCNSHQYSCQNKDSSTFVMLVCRVNGITLLHVHVTQ